MADESEPSSGGPPWVRVLVQVISSAGVIIAAFIAVPKDGGDKAANVIVQTQTVQQVQLPPSSVLPSSSASATKTPPITPAPDLRAGGIESPSGPSESKIAVGDATFSPCRAQPGILGLGGYNCSEESAVRANVCAVVPISAKVTAIRLYTKFLDETGTIEQRKPVEPNVDTGWSKFVGSSFETPISDGRSVCWQFLHWSSHQSRQARIAVTYN